MFQSIKAIRQAGVATKPYIHTQPFRFLPHDVHTSMMKHLPPPEKMEEMDKGVRRLYIEAGVKGVTEIQDVMESGEQLGFWQWFRACFVGGWGSRHKYLEEIRLKLGIQSQVKKFVCVLESYDGGDITKVSGRENLIAELVGVVRAERPVTFKLSRPDLPAHRPTYKVDINQALLLKSEGAEGNWEVGMYGKNIDLLWIQLFKRTR